MLAHSRLVSQVASATLDISNVPAETDAAQSATSVAHLVGKKAVVQLVKPALVSQVVLLPLIPSVQTVVVARLVQHAALMTLAIQNVVQVVQAGAPVEALAEVLPGVLGEVLADPPPGQLRALPILDSILLILALVVVAVQQRRPHFRKRKQQQQVVRRRPYFLVETMVVAEDPEDQMDLGVAVALPCAQPVR
jgi:hypothetical protein